MAQVEASVAMALPGAAIFGSAPIPVTAVLVSGHSRALTVEHIERVRSSPHLEMLRFTLRRSREGSQSRVASSVAQPTPRPLDGGHEGSGESGH